MSVGISWKRMRFLNGGTTSYSNRRPHRDRIVAGWEYMRGQKSSAGWTVQKGTHKGQMEFKETAVLGAGKAGYLASVVRLK